MRPQDVLANAGVVRSWFKNSMPAFVKSKLSNDGGPVKIWERVMKETF